jgi:hypothetical protein
METGLKITLLAAPDELSYFTPEYQQELRAFEKAFNDQGVPVDSERALAKMAGGPFLSGEFVLKVADKIGPPLIAGVAGWLHGRAGRKVRLKVGDIEAEAPTIEEVEKLLDRAQEIQQRNQPKVIHEP